MSKTAALVETVAGTGLLGSYIAYARTLTRAPLMYHAGTGLATIAGAVGSNVWWRGHDGNEQWPNLYLLLLGPSGNAKTTAMKIGMRLLNWSAPGTIYADEFSQEQFIKGLAAHPSLVLDVEEFATLLEMTQRSYMQGIKETLTKLFDPRPEFRRSTKGDGEIIIRLPSLTILGASTTDWLVKHLDEVDFRSGFMPRFLLVPQEETDREPDPGFTPRGDAHAENSLVRQLHAIATMPRAHVGFDARARKHLTVFVDSVERRSKEEGMRGELSGLVNRVGAYCGKVCALLAVADDGPLSEYEVSLDQAKRATALMGWLVDAAERLFEWQIVFEKFEKDVQRLLALIPETGIERSALLKRSRLPVFQFDRLMDTLEQRHEVAKRRPEHVERGRVPTIYHREYPKADAAKNGIEMDQNGKERDTMALGREHLRVIAPVPNGEGGSVAEESQSTGIRG